MKPPVNRAADRLKEKYPEVPGWMIDSAVATARQQMKDAILVKLDLAATFPSEVQAVKWVASLIASLE